MPMIKSLSRRLTAALCLTPKIKDYEDKIPHGHAFAVKPHCTEFKKI